MKFLCIAIGKKHDRAIAAAIDDYTERLARHTPLAWLVLPPAKGKMSIDETKRAEGAQILVRIEDDDYIVLLDERGVGLSSSGLAEFLDALDMQPVRRVVWIIGGAYGVDEAVKKRANFVWSLSRLVFPHQLVRLVMAEQLYRANAIRRGEPYHHE